jgi:SAM-dependent methyltransferase
MSDASNESSRQCCSGRKNVLLWLATAAAIVIVAGVITRQVMLHRYDPSQDSSIPYHHPAHNAPYIQTPDRVVAAFVEQAHATKEDVVYDLGCGDGRLVIAIAEQSGCRGIGFDIDPQRVIEARENAKKHHVESLVQFEERDVYSVDLSKATVVVAYLLPKMLEALIPQFDAMPSGSRIISHDFQIEGIVMDKAVDVRMETGDKNEHRVCVYTTPLRREPPKPNKKRQ